MAQKNEFKIFYAVSFAWQLGFLIVGPIGGFLLLGYWIDKMAGTSPLFLMIGVMIGLGITIYEVYHMLDILIRHDDGEKDANKKE
jgi:F0F1-type ATP synthase assembly protein I